MNKAIVKVLMLAVLTAILPAGSMAARGGRDFGETYADATFQPVYNYNYQTSCVAMTCPQLGYQCGQFSDGCGGSMYCGTCTANNVCSAGHCVYGGQTCQPQSCSQLGLQCGTVYDGCSGNIYCGSCSGNQTCQNGRCVYSAQTCQPQTCQQLGYQCGQFNDGCGNTINCGNCQNNNQPANFSVTLAASPNSGCNNGNVSLTATVNGYGNNYNSNYGGQFTYYFTCGSDSRTVSSSETSVTVNNICASLNQNSGSQTASVRVTRDGFDASDQTQVNTGNCDYNNGTNRQLKVSLYADPGTGCAPVNGVNLRALVTNAGISGYNGNYNDNSNGQLTYSFDCDNNGTFEKTITSADSEIIVSNLCSYSTAGIYTARVRVDLRGQWATDTAIIKANNCGYPYLSPVIQPNNIQPITPIYNQPGAGISVQKMVANLSNGSAYQSAVTAAPGDFVSFKIVISSASGGSDLTVSDIIPAGITNVRDVRLDGQPIDGSIASGINIGNLYPNQQRIVIFTATIGAASSFPYGQTTLTDIATARNSSMSNSSTAVIYVLRQTVLGATNVSTGILGAEWVNYLIAGILALIAAAWLCKDSLISVYRALKSYKNTLIGKA